MNAGLERHINEDDLEEYALGRLTGVQGTWLEDHLLVCPTCQDRLAEIDEYVRVMKAAAAAVALETSEHSAA